MQCLSACFSLIDAHTVADVDYKWKGGDGKGVEIVSSEMAQFDLRQVKTLNDASINSKGMSCIAETVNRQLMKITFPVHPLICRQNSIYHLPELRIK